MPQTPLLYRQYLIFENMTGEVAKHISIEHGFEFNALIFPLHRKSDKVVFVLIVLMQNIYYLK